jgi:hypothetical protein
MRHRTQFLEYSRQPYGPFIGINLLKDFVSNADMKLTTAESIN